MARWRLSVEYDGADFQGWQLQSAARSVQGELEAAFRQVTGETVRVHGAGRTDAGVHARGQVAHVDCATGLDASDLLRALNAVLPQDVALRSLSAAPPAWSARHDVEAKAYVYRIWNRPQPSPLRRRDHWHLRPALDAAAMAEAAVPLLGVHDFAAFRGAPGGAPEGEQTRRSLDRLEVVADGSGALAIWAEGRSFLRYMVRTLVGTLVEIGRGLRPPGEAAEILASGDRGRAGATAPAHGLTLEWIRYPGDPPLGPGAAPRRDASERASSRPGGRSGAGDG